MTWLDSWIQVIMKKIDIIIFLLSTVDHSSDLHAQAHKQSPRTPIIEFSDMKLLFDCKVFLTTISDFK